MTLQLWDSLDYLLDDFISIYVFAAAAKSCLTLWDPIDGSPPGSPCPWDSPGKNTGVGCHFLLQCMKVKGESEVVQSCLTLNMTSLSHIFILVNRFKKKSAILHPKNHP